MVRLRPYIFHIHAKFSPWFSDLTKKSIKVEAFLPGKNLREDDSPGHLWLKSRQSVLAKPSYLILINTFFL